jgi:hypothetical protein
LLCALATERILGLATSTGLGRQQLGQGPVWRRGAEGQ